MGKRYYFIDTLRGLAVLSMVLYHFAWDLRYIAGVINVSFLSLPALFWQQSICIGFILISGFCFYISRRPLKNGIITFLSGGAVTLATLIFTPYMTVYFGVLTLLGSAMLMLLPIRKYLAKIPPLLGFFIFFSLFLIFYTVNNGSVLFGLVSLPDFLYKNMLTAYLGFPHGGFSSGDYFPLLPWIFLFISGFFLCGILNEYREPKLLFWRAPVLEFIGRNALIIYLAHQPILYGITLLINQVN